MSLSLNLYQSMALAVAIFYFGAFLKSKISVFRTYCIPSPVIGGIIYAIVNLILYQTGVLQLSVDTTLQSVFMNVFFTSVGFTAGFGMLKKGGKSLIVFLVAVCILIGIQDVAGAALCKVFGLQPLLGLALGSMPLTGGHGTTTAFAPLLESMGVQNALTVGVAAATYGLVAGNVIGNPLARRRIKKLGLSSSDAAQVDHEALLELKKNTEGTAKPGVKDFLAAAKTRRIPVVATSIHDAEVCRTLFDHAGIATDISAIASGWEKRLGGGDSALFRQGIALLNAPEGRVWAFNDGAEGVFGAKGAGCMIAAIYDENHSDREWQQITSSADVAFMDWHEATAWLAGCKHSL